ncbi:MAG: EpsG family protein [Muribaculaceae bacterium]|nr:EpsG family protein [Muribaculaceae bacterium]
MISPLLYSTVFLYFTLILTFIVAIKVRNQSYQTIIHHKQDTLFTFLICLVLAIWLGQRPPEYYHVFGDSFTYAHKYELYSIDSLKTMDDFDKKGEYIWNYGMYYFSHIIDVQLFFTIVSCLYFGFTLWACRKLTKNDTLVSFLFFLGSLSFYTYAVNGLRNGLACSIVLVGIAFLSQRSRTRWLSILFFIVAYYIHRSTIIPISMAFMAILIKNRFSIVFPIWIASILISAVLGGTVANIFMNLGFDDRVDSYLTVNNSSLGAGGGFRLDFLLYSMMPIIFGYYSVFKRHIKDGPYLLLLNTYTLANAIWVIVIRANYSNRIAYLSWFLYPIVLAYPLLRINLWGPEQGKILARIMLAQMGFTWFMQTFIWHV